MSQQLKQIKTRLRNELNNANLAHLMKIAIEGPELSSVNFDEVLEVFANKVDEFSYSIAYNYYSHLYFNFYIVIT